MGKTRAACTFLAVSCLLIAAGGSAGAEVYQYVDGRGVWHFTNVPASARYTPVRMRPTRPQPPQDDSYDALIESASREHRLPPALVKAVVAAESAFDPTAVSPKGAMGLMQLMPATADHLGVEDPFAPSANVFGGTRYLRTLHKRYGSWTHALAAYNAGPTAVDRYRGVPPYPETRAYVKRVLTYYRQFHGDFSR